MMGTGVTVHQLCLGHEGFMLVFSNPFYSGPGCLQQPPVGPSIEFIHWLYSLGFLGSCSQCSWSFLYSSPRAATLTGSCLPPGCSGTCHIKNGLWSGGLGHSCFWEAEAAELVSLLTSLFRKPAGLTLHVGVLKFHFLLDVLFRCCFVWFSLSVKYCLSKLLYSFHFLTQYISQFRVWF